MKYKIICDYQENFKSVSQNGHINDHQDKETFENIQSALKQKGYDCEIFEGVPALLEAINRKVLYPDTIFLNLSDGMEQHYSRVQIPILCELLNVPQSGGNAFTVNAAPYAVGFYHKIGFEDVAPQLMQDGIRYTPMEWIFA